MIITFTLLKRYWCYDVRFRRPNAEAFDNEDSIQVNDFSRSVDATIIEEDEDVDDDNNNNGKRKDVIVVAPKDKASDDTAASDVKETPSGESRFRKMVGGCKEKFKISRKKINTVIPQGYCYGDAADINCSRVEALLKM